MRALPTAILDVAAGSALTTAVLAQPMAVPGRRAGLWEMSMSGAAIQGHSMKMRQCVDPATERNFSPFNSGPGGQGNTHHHARRPGDNDPATPLAGGARR